MEIVQSNEAFKTIDGKFQFAYVKIFVRQDNILYSAKWMDRKNKPHDMSQLQDVRRVETQNRGLEVHPSWTIAPQPLDSYYIKTPSLLAYATESDLEKQILREVETCELLRKHPHRNIAFYYGCQVTRNRVSGLCFKRYTSTLQENVNPQHLNKRTFFSSGRELVDDGIKASLDGILQGIRHLHSLGLVHNDVTPSNIMFGKDNTPVLVDFGSCRRVAESLRDRRLNGHMNGMILTLRLRWRRLILTRLLN
ncbi:hypothetical protein AJ79_08102 [Helicocarpus griseus UAMH5409]|uniref:EKC/KEOPS complex subunit BUD32 n=1 Tax=Helicocarpus griseus UAMH5409 TaxID=1447875 RepID=A0A2B7WN16_9EURO|nr:hypothetical protein AJ79_08102 [Helicocarpus griseus UAMH5409]